MKKKNVARKVASQTWGEVQHQLKLADGIWLFDTARHGGIVTDFLKRPETSFKPVFVYTRAGRTDGNLGEQHYAVFEEDCEANMVEWLNASEIMTQRYMKRFLPNSSITLETWKKQRLELIEASLKFWYPKFLKQYPDPDMGTYTPNATMF